MIKGFVSHEGEYAAVPYGKKLMILHKGQQLDVVNTTLQAQKYIKQHKKTSSQSGPIV